MPDAWSPQEMKLLGRAVRWDNEKNIRLKKTRGIGFEEIVEAIEDNLLDDMRHPNAERYPHQRIFVVRLNEYAYVVPYVVADDNSYVLKTAYPDRAMMKKYLREDED